MVALSLKWPLAAIIVILLLAVLVWTQTSVGAGRGDDVREATPEQIQKEWKSQHPPEGEGWTAYEEE